MEKNAIGLYVHIPFCVRKCAYCDFLSAPASEETKECYVNLLCEEIEREAARYPGYRGKTVFFGGGTPTTLRPEQLERILRKLEECFSAGVQEGHGRTLKKEGLPGEITIECNPGTVSAEDLRYLRKAGFNRLSIGLQSAQDGELKKLGRIHNWKDFLETYHGAREAGFGNINVDIISALPGQSPESYEDTLRKVAALCPEHISAYSLIIEEGTPFYERYGEADRQRKRDGEDRAHLLPSEEEERRMYELTEEALAQKGYRRYEISNYALPGYECRHNIAYWRRENYLGFGLGAASLMENCRFTKPGDMDQYRNLLTGGGENAEGPAMAPMAGGFHRDIQRLSAGEQMEEFMFLGLRLTKGISAGEFCECFRVPIEDIYGGAFKRLKEQGLLSQEGDRIFLTKRGIDVSNVALAEFLL